MADSRVVDLPPYVLGMLDKYSSQRNVVVVENIVGTRVISDPVELVHSPLIICLFVLGPVAGRVRWSGPTSGGHLGKKKSCDTL